MKNHELTKDKLINKIVINIRQLDPLCVALPLYEADLNHSELVMLADNLDRAVAWSENIYEDIMKSR